MREFGLLHETDPSLPSSKLEATLFNDCESSLPLESDFVDDAHLINPNVELDPPLTSLLLIAPSFSNTPIDTIVSDLALLASPLPLAQCIGLEMGDFSRGDVSAIADAYLVRRACIS